MTPLEGKKEVDSIPGEGAEPSLSADVAPKNAVKARLILDEPAFDLVEDTDDDSNRWPLEEIPDPNAKLRRWVRGSLILMAAAFVTVFGIAIWLNPYNADGSPKKMSTHTQLGLEPCNMVRLIGKPCATCGMTTAFSLLTHGDVPNSLRANWVGTLLALFWLVLIPWSMLSGLRGRYVWVRSGEKLLTISSIALVGLALFRWVFVLLSV